MTASFRLGSGTVWCDDGDGAPVRVTHPDHGQMTFLLGEDSDDDFHQPPFRWGKGFVITDAGSYRWDQPDQLSIGPAGIDARYGLGPLELTARRRFGERWTERYRFTNNSGKAVAVGTLAISTPFRDVYRDAASSLSGACHAHIWTGGADSYVWAIRMDGCGPGLGLALTAGELWSYSIESRNGATSSNTRGHIYLQLTDHARAPHAMGGQPRVIVEPGGAIELAWELGWYDAITELPRSAAAEPSSVAATLPGPIPVTMYPGAQLTLPESVSATLQPDGRVALHATAPGIHYVEVQNAERHSRFAVLFHRPLREIVERRAAYILDHQLATDRDPSRAAAFLPYDTRSGLRLNEGGWSDWSDGRERLGMPRMLQEARRRGWGDNARIDDALHNYARFLRTHLVSDDGRVRAGSFAADFHRLYNYPWVAAFAIAQYELYGDPSDLELAIRIVDRYYESGGAHFLAIGISECVTALAPHSDRMREHAIAHAEHFL